MKKRLVVANWKRYVESPVVAKKFISGLRRRSRLFPGVEVVLASSYPLIPTVSLALKGSSMRTGAQAVSGLSDSKHTGEVSARTLAQSGVSYVIVGHSERRALGESDEIVRTQLEQLAAEELTPILCVGESERNSDGVHFSFIEKQLSRALSGMRVTEDRLVVAYEPLWAIGKSAQDAMKPEALTETVIFIRKTLAELLERKAALKVPILYGGSVEPDNAHTLITEGGVGGFLVGHASAELGSFIEILKACKK